MPAEIVGLGQTKESSFSSKSRRSFWLEQGIRRQ